MRRRDARGCGDGTRVGVIRETRHMWVVWEQAPDVRAEHARMRDARTWCEDKARTPTWIDDWAYRVWSTGVTASACSRNGIQLQH
jgi:hypothetical protein